MKFRKNTYLAFIVLSFLLIGCSKDDEEKIPQSDCITGIPVIDLKAFLPDVDFIAYKKDFQDGNANHYVLGVKNSHLWVRIYQSDSLSYISEGMKIVLEWEDTDIINTKVDSTYLGYGNYKISPAITEIRLYNATKNANGFFAHYGIYPPQITTNRNYLRSYCLFVSNRAKKVYQYDLEEGEGGPVMRKWFNGAIIINNCCYSEKGDTLYTLNNAIDSSIIPVSYEDGVNIGSGYITKYNYKENKTVWSTKITSPYNEPSNSRYTYTLLNRSTSMLKYKVDILYYDGTKKEFVFTVNLDDGKISIVDK